MTVWTTCWAPCTCCWGEISCSRAVSTSSVYIAGAVFKFVFTLDTANLYRNAQSLVKANGSPANHMAATWLRLGEGLVKATCWSSKWGGNERLLCVVVWHHNRFLWCFHNLFSISREWDRLKEKLSPEWTFCWHQKRMGRPSWRHRLYIKIDEAPGCTKNWHCVTWPTGTARNGCKKPEYDWLSLWKRKHFWLV